jgi:hypothetical protein
MLDIDEVHRVHEGRARFCAELHYGSIKGKPCPYLPDKGHLRNPR